REAALGQADGRTPPQDAGSLSRMPRGHSSRTAETASVQDIGPLESCLRSKDSRAVRRGAVGKVPQGNSPAAYSTARPVREGAVGVPRKRARPPTSITLPLNVAREF